MPIAVSAWLFAWAIVVVLLTIGCLIQERQIKNSVQALGWFGSLCLALIVLGALFLFAIGIL